MPRAVALSSRQGDNDESYAPTSSRAGIFTTVGGVGGKTPVIVSTAVGALRDDSSKRGSDASAGEPLSTDICRVGDACNVDCDSLVDDDSLAGFYIPSLARCLATHTGRPRCVHKNNGRLKGSKGMLYRNVARKDGRVGRAEVAEAEVISDPHAWMAGMEDCSDS